MADVQSCINDMVAAGKVTKALGEEALALFERSKAEFSMKAGPASSDAAAALTAAKQMRDKALERQINIATTVKAYQLGERRVLEDPRGRNAGLVGQVSKDTLTGTKELNALLDKEPTHPIASGGNADYRAQVIKGELFSELGADLEKYKTGIKSNPQLIESSRNFIRERFGVNTGDALAKQVSDGFGRVIDIAANRAKAAGKIFKELEDWRVFQNWQPSQVARVTPDQYVKDHMAEVANGGLKLFDKETGKYATASKYDEILRRAYSDIKTEGGQTAPFSKDLRTFEFQPGSAGAESWLKLQGKYGAGNEIMSTLTSHVERMSRDIALHEQFGGSPDAVFAALLRLVKEDPSVPVKGAGWMTSAQTIQRTYDNVSGRGMPVASETMARIFAGARSLLGIASLRNLPITIIPGDAAMTQLAAHHLGMDGVKVLGEIFNGSLSKEDAAHLQISAHGYMDFVNNTVRKYEDQINVSGLINKVSRGVVKATGAELWTANGRQGWQASMLNQLASMGDKAFGDLEANTRQNFLARYGFTAADWDKIRSAPTFDPGNGAKYLDPTAIDRDLSERLMMAIKEQGSYAFHQPDARTQAIMRGNAIAGSPSGEFWLSAGQYKQFAMERMTTHLMRILMDGPLENRVTRGIAFTILSTVAGAVSLQAAAVLAGKDPLDMTHPTFWANSFLRSGAGGIYADVVDSAFHGNRGTLDIASELGGPLPGFVSDVANVAVAPVRQAFDPSSKRAAAQSWEDRGEGSFVNRTIQMGRRWTPQTWYSKAATDRLIWDKLQILTDPNYRQSFARAQRYAQKQGTNFWFPPGTSAPARGPNLGNAIGR